MAEPSRLEQVIINLLVNARDAIEDKIASGMGRRGEEKIFVKTFTEGKALSQRWKIPGPGSLMRSRERFRAFLYDKEKWGRAPVLAVYKLRNRQDFGGTIEAFSNQEEELVLVIRFLCLVLSKGRSASPADHS